MGWNAALYKSRNFYTHIYNNFTIFYYLNLSNKILKAGDVFHFPPGAVHQEEALTNCQIIEASSPHFNDRVRVDERYGFSSKNGLPSTKKNNVIKK